MDAKYNISPKEISELLLIHGTYEGIEYYQLMAVTSWGHKLKVKLNKFEYDTLAQKYVSKQ